MNPPPPVTSQVSAIWTVHNVFRNASRGPVQLEYRLGFPGFFAPFMTAVYQRCGETPRKKRAPRRTGKVGLAGLRTLQAYSTDVT